MITIFLIILIVLILFTLLYLWMIYPSRKHTSDMEDYNHMCVAHRGLHNHCCENLDPNYFYPENSLPSYKEAMKAGIAIEIDIHLTTDQQIVVFHDDDLIRMCHSCLKVEKSTYEELQKYTLSHSRYRIPLFSEVLSLVRGQVPLLIELKLPSHDTSLCSAAAQMLDHYQGKYLIQSFNPLGLHWFMKNRPNVLRGQLSSDLTAYYEPTPWILRFLVKHLLTNCCCRPDFISYKYEDCNNFSLHIIRKLFPVPIAVWTLQNELDFKHAYGEYNILIFEKLSMNFINIL